MQCYGVAWYSDYETTVFHKINIYITQNCTTFYQNLLANISLSNNLLIRYLHFHYIELLIRENKSNTTSYQNLFSKYYKY